MVYRTYGMHQSWFPTGLPALDSVLGGEGFPEKSTVLVVGPPGIGKEALGYWFTYPGLIQNDFCLYTTRLSASRGAPGC